VQSPCIDAPLLLLVVLDELALVLDELALLLLEDVPAPPPAPGMVDVVVVVVVPEVVVEVLEDVVPPPVPPVPFTAEPPHARAASGRRKAKARRCMRGERHKGGA
jgi:hypothetical protein